MKRGLVIFLLLAAIVALPLLLRREAPGTGPGEVDDRIVILSPHNESIRAEFGTAFERWWKQRTGRTIYVDWRTPGGASEIRMVIDAGYKAAKETGRQGIGVDVYFGGGEPDFSEQARHGRLAPLDVFKLHPGWFGPDEAVPPSFTGERYYSSDHTWVGCCVSRFGIAYNPETLKRLGVAPPVFWDDLGNPKFAGELALSDPTKSGSVARAFELLVQEQMRRSLGHVNPDGIEAAKAVGWANGLRLIQRMSANARYFTDSASKIPRDISQGDAAAGMCIDFYGRSYQSDALTKEGAPRLVWAPANYGSTLSADPVAVLQGAPSPEIAQAFVEFCLSPEIQPLWFLKPGTPGGPERRALHRMPIRRDVYAAGIPENSTMPGENPYTGIGNLTYDRELTGHAFGTLRRLVKVMCIDSHEELKDAWLAMRDAGFPEEAMKVFSDVSFVGYEEFGHGDRELDGKDPFVSARRATELGERFRANYRRAAGIARERRAEP